MSLRDAIPWLWLALPWAAGFVIASWGDRASRRAYDVALRDLGPTAISVTLVDVERRPLGEPDGRRVTVTAIDEPLRLVLDLPPWHVPQGHRLEMFGERPTTTSASVYRDAGGMHRFVPRALVWSRPAKTSARRIYGWWSLFVIAVLTSAYAVDCGSDRAFAHRGIHSVATLTDKPYYASEGYRNGSVHRSYRYDFTVHVDGTTGTIRDVGENASRDTPIGTAIDVVYLSDSLDDMRFEYSEHSTGVSFAIVFGLVSLFVALFASGAGAMVVDVERCESFTEA